MSRKANQGLLFDEVTWLFDYHRHERLPMDKAESFDVAHGRQATRTGWLKDFSSLEHAECGLATWQQRNIIVVDAHVLTESKATNSRRFFSHAFCASQALERVRKHGSIDNQQPYPLDLLFNEAVARTRRGFAAQNLAVLRRLARKLLNLDTSFNASKRRKRFKALLDDDYLLNLLGLEAIA